MFTTGSNLFWSMERKVKCLLLHPDASFSIHRISAQSMRTNFPSFSRILREYGTLVMIYNKIFLWPMPLFLLSTHTQTMHFNHCIFNHSTAMFP
jgi:hypothetical protein